MSSNASLLKYSFDIVDYHVERIFLTREKRVERWESLEAFWGLYPYKDAEFGQLYCRKKLAEILVQACSSPGYEPTEDETSLECWTKDDWEQLRSDLLLLREIVSRKDSLLTQPCPEDGADNEDLVAMEKPWNRFDRMVKRTILHQVLAPIRSELQKQLADENLQAIDLPATTITRFFKEIQKLEDDQCRALLMGFFQEEEEGSKKRKGRPELASIETIRELMAPKASFDLDAFQTKLEALVISFLSPAIMGNRTPVLFNRNYDIPIQDIQASMISKRIGSLRKARQKLRANQEDPLEESRAIAQSQVIAQAVTSTPLATQLAEDDAEEEEYDAAGAQQLQTLPRQKRSRPIGMGSPDYMAPDPDIFDEFGKVKRRRRWTNEEKACIKLGVEHYGVGDWQSIKLDYPEILRNRTTVQIKDCWRTMIKRGEVESVQVRAPPTERAV